MESIYGQIIRVILVLIAIVAAMLAFRRYGGKYKLDLMRQKETPYSLKKLNTIHLGNRKFVSVVEVSDRILIIGIGEKDLTLLTQWTKGEDHA
jgi:flagellar biogenesis protein FliO